MTTNACQALADLLRDTRGGGSFCTRRTAPVDDLAIDVQGAGPLRLPVTATQAKELRLLARPARYGKGEQTILDRQVRDTWEVPRSRVKIDKRRWNQTLHPMLDTIREDLGLPVTSSLKAELHSMLVYEPGQFFAAHQDSEKNDQMIGSVVVLLPSRTEGGELVVEHRGQSVTYQGSASSLTFVAFYADTRHEVLPVTRGYRVALTYNLMLSGSSTPVIGEDTSLTATAVELLEHHFTHPPEPRWRGDSQAAEPPDRLVFLLDHQYTERGLRWSQLKGDDATRADVLRRAAHEAGCDVALAHAEIHETWDYYERAPRWQRRGRSSWDDDLDGDDHELGDLLDSTVEIAPANRGTFGFDRHVAAAELAASTPSVELTPYETEYTGDMGNWGNTMDRWYRRAAIVIWPHARAFAVRAKGDPVGALGELLGCPAGDVDAARARADNVSTLLRFWPDGVRQHDQQSLLPPTLRLAWELDDEAFATRLLEPFDLEAVTPADATVLLALTEQHGQRWFEQQLTTWMNQRPRFPPRTPTSREAWVESVPELCDSLLDDQHASTDLKTDLARTVVNRAWNWLRVAIHNAAAITRPSTRQAALHDLAAPLLAVMRSSAIADDPALRRVIIDSVCDKALELSPMLLGVIEASTALPHDHVVKIDVVTLARHSARTLQQELARPERAGDDWSITEYERGNCCNDCADLAAFLTDPAKRQLVWPLAKARRQHIHQRIDEAELPVTHQTTRQGSPHQLVLTKTSDLFTRDAERRARTQTSLDSVQQLLSAMGERPLSANEALTIPRSPRRSRPRT